MVDTKKEENVFLFVPNLIGYGRVILGVFALAAMPYDAWVAMALYSVSCILDAVDGHAARYFGQSEFFVRLFNHSARP